MLVSSLVADAGFHCSVASVVAAEAEIGALAVRKVGARGLSGEEGYSKPGDDAAAWRSRCERFVFVWAGENVGARGFSAEGGIRRAGGNAAALGLRFKAGEKTVA